MENQRKYSAHYISGTHWDREWYRTFQEFRLLFVDLVDGLLTLLETNPNFKFFHFDGQTCVLPDYLQVRPENRGRLAKLIKDGRILIGPWYTMPDLFCPGAEALVRNLLTGQRISGEWDTTAMPVAYTCDMFGHPSQMPQIYNGFGLKYCVLGRGTNEFDTPAFFTWKAHDGSTVLTFKLQDYMGYGAFIGARQVLEGSTQERGSGTETNEEQARKSLREYIGHEIERSNAPVLCLIDALDHMPPAGDAPRYVAAAEAACPEVSVRHSTLTAFFKEAEAALEGVELPVRQSELRDPAKNRVGYLWLIPNCVSSRIHIKQANDACQALLELGAEPMMAIAQQCGFDPVPARLRQIAWENLLLCHAHDSICGCSIDQVHRDMMHRFDQVLQLGRQIRNRSFARLTAASRNLATKPDEFTFTLMNTLPRRQKGAVVAEVRFPTNWPRKFHDAFRAQPINGFIIEDAEGKRVEYQIMGMAPHCSHRSEYSSLTDMGANAEFDSYTLSLDTELPPCGFKSLLVKPADMIQRSVGSLRTGPFTAENAFIAVSICPNGTLKLMNKETGDVYRDLLMFEDRSETGDGWFHGQSMSDEIALSAGSASQISVLSDGPLAVVFRVQVTMNLPKRYNWNLQCRSEARENVKIVSKVTLRKGARAVEIETEVDNTVEDHRLRVLFPTDIADAKTWLAHHPYDWVERPVALRAETRDWSEMDLPEKPFLNLQTVRNESRGLAFISGGGVHEGGVVDDERRTMQVTLFRSYRRTVGTPGEHDGLELGKTTFRFALMPYGDKLPNSELFGEMQALQTESLKRQTGPCSSGYPAMKGSEAPDRSFMEFMDGNLVFSALKPAEDGDGMILRVWNPTAEAASERINIWKAPTCVFKTNLGETEKGEAVAVNGTQIDVTAQPWQIVTLRIRI